MVLICFFEECYDILNTLEDTAVHSFDTTLEAVYVVHPHEIRQLKSQLDRQLHEFKNLFTLVHFVLLSELEHQTFEFNEVFWKQLKQIIISFDLLTFL